MRNEFLGILLSALVVCVGASCARSTRPWMQDGERLGTIHSVKDGAGRFYDYRDAHRRLVRRERHLRKGDLDTAFAVENHGYDAAGHETFLAFTDAEGRSTLGPTGFATRRTERRSALGISIIEHRYYDANDVPMLLSAAYHREEVQVDAKGQVLRRRFYDERDRPAGANLEEASSVFEVRYKRLTGVTPIVYETFLDLDGKPVFKRQLSGSTLRERVRTTRFDRYGYRY